MAKTNTDGTVTMKDPGEVAQNPSSGSGTGQIMPVAAKKSAAGPKVVRTKGRGAAGRSATAH